MMLVHKRKNTNSIHKGETMFNNDLYNCVHHAKHILKAQILCTYNDLLNYLRFLLYFPTPQLSDNSKTLA